MITNKIRPYSDLKKYHANNSQWLPDSGQYAREQNTILDNTLPYGSVPSWYNSSLTVFGDSITAGSTAKSGFDYPSILGRYLGLTVTNLAGSGRGLWLMAQQANLDSTLSNDSGRLITAMAGLNDIRRSRTDNTYRKLLTCYRNLCVMKFRTTTVAAGSSSVTRTGSHLAFAGSSVGGKYTNTAIPGATTSTYLSAAGSWSYTFTGDNVAIGLFGSGPTVNYGNATVTIDGRKVLDYTASEWYDDVSDGTYDNQRGPVSFWFPNLGYRSHTITVTWVSGGNVAMDYFAILRNPYTTGVKLGGCVLMDVPYIRDYFKSGLDQANRDLTDKANAIIAQVYREFRTYGYPVVNLKTNAFYDCDAEADPTDGTHPLTKGHHILARAVLSVFNDLDGDMKSIS